MIMSVNEYSFVTIWKLEASIQDVWDVICAPENLTSWWKSIIAIEVIDRGDDNGVNFLAKQTWKGVF
jgi:uncharacterized protein YndB with AHSA1/START domain